MRPQTDLSKNKGKATKSADSDGSTPEAGSGVNHVVSQNGFVWEKSEVQVVWGKGATWENQIYLITQVVGNGRKFPRGLGQSEKPGECMGMTRKYP